ncbi:RCC1 domain-containing protein 1-like [Amphibalanus amphitrite]|uniref:RCC1 domain-containing protein 1-like n=1 Tax=Amphibalanus amphitrite TaxID=1232801 RepID=UPI001C912901|nr:RCC1 domain-containing protein 1-like [Amphibalanus amphitrite]XP_043244132.1 RCC1 domain-containing protein 1-like [Amphibalanus amphitrite]
MLRSAEDRLVALYPDGSTWLRTTAWRRLALQSAGQETAEPARHVSIGRHTLAACDTGGSLLTLDGVPTPAGERLQAISCGREHVVLLTRSGRVFTFGGGSRGQLGTGELSSSDMPQLVTALDGLAITQVCAGGWHTAALSSSGDVYTWGWNESGQLGLGDTVNVAAEPALVDALPSDVTVTQLACGSRHTLALLEDGSVMGWGWNGHGQLALPPCDRSPPRALPLPERGTVVRVAAGGWNSALVTREDS